MLGGADKLPEICCGREDALHEPADHFLFAGHLVGKAIRGADAEPAVGLPLLHVECELHSVVHNLADNVDRWLVRDVRKDHQQREEEELPDEAQLPQEEIVMKVKCVDILFLCDAQRAVCEAVERLGDDLDGVLQYDDGL